MEKVRLGKAELWVSRIGFGGLPIQRLSEAEAISLVRHCIGLGVDFFDTARSYGTSEAYIGKAIDGQRDGVVVASGTLATDVEKVKQELNQSLEQLNVDSMDLYQLQHISDMDAYRKVTQPGGALAFLQDAKARGLIRHIGITSHSMEVAREAVASGLFETLMFHFSFISDEAQDGLIQLCQEHDVGFIAMKVMAGGLLENASLAFKYLKQFPHLVPVVGIEKAEEIEEIIHIFRDPAELTEMEKRQMASIRERLGTKFCRRCGHCLPCEQGVHIPNVMNVITGFRRLPLSTLLEGVYSVAVATVSSCIECGTCEERCPFSLPVRDMLKENVAFFEQQRSAYRTSA